MPRAAVPISELLRKMRHHDQDERYMATSDLCTILQNHTNAATATGSNNGLISSSSSSNYPNLHTQHHYSSGNIMDNINEHSEQQICSSVLSLLDDQSNDVQSVAVKTLGELLKIVHEQQAIEIANRLCALMLDKEKKELRDVYTIGLRTLIQTVSPRSMGETISQILVDRLMDGIRKVSLTTEDKDYDYVSCILDVMTDLITKFGSTSRAIQQRQRDILNVTLELSLSTTQRPEVKKRAGNVIGCLAVVISDDLLFHLVQTLLNYIRGAGDKQSATSSSIDTQACIQTMCTISGKVGKRLSKHIDKIIPIFLQFCNPEDANISHEDHEDDDYENNIDITSSASSSNQLRESCFAGFESFLLNCPKEVEPFLPLIVHSAIAFMRYDPNYNEIDEDEEDMDMNEDGYEDEDEDDEEYSDEDFDNYSDDEDDDAWKVRRSAVRTLNALVHVVKNEPAMLWTEEFTYFGEKKKTPAGALVNRFKERDEACRVDVIECFTGLLYTTIAASKSNLVSVSLDENDVSKNTLQIVKENYVPTIIKACHSQLSINAKKTGEKTKSSILALISVVCANPGGLGNVDRIKTIFTHAKRILTDKAGTKTLKLDALCMIRNIFTSGTHDPTDLRDSLDVILPSLCTTVQEDWYKIIAEALRVLAELPKLIDLEDLNYPTSDITLQLYSAISPRLAAHDLDQEIKEYALDAAGTLLISLHRYLSETQKEDLLQRILERLENETTRLVAIKTISSIAKAEPKLDISCILSNTLRELASLVRQQNRGVKQSALETMNTIIIAYGKDDIALEDELLDSVLKALGSIIVDSDVHLSHLSILCTISILKEIPSSGKFVTFHVLPPALKLSSSSVLQDVALNSLLSFFKQLITSNTVVFSDLLSSLESRIESGEPLAKQSLGNLAQCIAVICASTDATDRDKVVRRLISTLESNGINSTNVVLTQLALLTSGELGQRVNLSQLPDVSEKLRKICLECFESSSEDIKHAAAFAMGRSAVGSMDAFLPPILSSLESAVKQKRYLLLTVLKELIVCHQINTIDMTSSIPKILPHLLEHTTDKEEGVRAMVAECLGSLVCIKPDVILPELSAQIDIENKSFSPEEAKQYALMAWTVASAIKVAIASKPFPQLLASYLSKFTLLLRKNEFLTEEDNLSIRNAALLMVYSAVHHAPKIVAGLMPEYILPSLYELAQLNLERQIDMGCFKHKVDIALTSRKTSLGIFATALENCPTCLDIPSFVPILTKALSDVEDVQLQAHQIVISMCSHHPLEVAAAVDIFVDPLQKSINKNPKGKKTGIELERANEFKKSGLRAVWALKNVEEAASSEKLRAFVEDTEKNIAFRTLLESIAAEH